MQFMKEQFLLSNSREGKAGDTFSQCEHQQGETIVTS